MTFPILALICAVALAGPLINLRQMAHTPVVIGELAVGILLGRTGLQLVSSDDPTFEFMAQIGFALVMFVAGTQVPIRRQAMASGLGRAVGRALGVAVLAVPLGFALAQAFGMGSGAVYAVVLASSSASVVMPALGGVKVTSQAGLEMLAQLAVADAACIVALPLVLDPAHALRAALGAVALVLVAAMFFLVLRWGVRTGRQHALHVASERRGLAIELRITLTMLFSLAAIAATMKVSVMLAGFAMGLVIAAIGEPRRLSNQTFALTEGFFAPVFFVWLGSSLDLRALASNPSAIWLGISLGVGALLVHGALALTRQPVTIAVSTGAQLGVPLGAAALGKTTGLLAEGEATALLLGALVTIAVVTALSGRLVRLVAPQNGADAQDPTPRAA